MLNDKIEKGMEDRDALKALNPVMAILYLFMVASVVSFMLPALR